MNVNEFMQRYKRAASNYLNELDKNKLENLNEFESKMDANIVKEFQDINTLLLDEKFLDRILDEMTLEELCEFEEMIELDKVKIAKILSENPQINNYINMKNK
ncbi:hypothetical protein C672_3658 [[Clostridium] bifermentans ATCC 638]|uniref:Uncharacterized protein n=1 Tax=Paraclostridium bifermentans ATCC 638 = DSM 14991 TaxID=1233171 RepID=T4VGJ8_PARBF|nr:hypothetical protein [Paraclostridium bifermentans]EQK39807.1 hypothetical protein C672_3658 [[Clostridium] bifermentans ATCC 638] [Paraclostridium bifermentans ATCC 638 = DSM 14991]